MKHVKLFEQFINKANIINEEDGAATFKPGSIIMPWAYTLTWKEKNLDLGEDTQAIQYDFEFEMVPDYSETIGGEKIKQTLVMAISDDSIGMYKVGEDIEKFTGLPLADAKKYNETPDDAFVYGMCNVMNGGKDSFFWTNGLRLKGQAAVVGALPAVIEQLSHEVGTHLTRLVLTKLIAQRDGVNITNEDWISYDYGAGEYVWPAVGDPSKNAPIIGIDEESFATANSAFISMLTPGFFKMASKYLPDLPKL